MVYLVDPKVTCLTNRCRPVCGVYCGIKPCYGVPTCRQIEL